MLKWTWKHQGAKSNSLIKFDHMQHEKHKMGHQGKQWCYIGFDEICQFTESQFWYLISRNRSMCGVRPYVRATCNPDPDSWVRRFIDWWIGKDGLVIPERSGVIRYFVREGDDIFWGDSEEQLREEQADLFKRKKTLKPMSFTFIKASLADNKILEEQDPDYRNKLEALPRVEREQLLGGNWNVKAANGDYFKKEWCEYIEPSQQPVYERVVRYWDRASTKLDEARKKKGQDPDYTVGLKMGLYAGKYFIIDVVRFRDRPHGVRERIRNTASMDEEGVKIYLEQDPGQAGQADVDNLIEYLAGYSVYANPVNKAKETRFQPFSAQAEGNNVVIVKGPWNESFTSELEQLWGGNHDDQADAASGAFSKLAKNAPRPRIRSLYD